MTAIYADDWDCLKDGHAIAGRECDVCGEDAAEIVRTLEGLREQDEREAESLRTALTAATARAERAEALLREVVETWAVCKVREFDAPEDEDVRALGSRIGFGALMHAAEKEWRRSLQARHREAVGGEFVSGPCRVTVDRLCARIEALLGGEG